MTISSYSLLAATYVDELLMPYREPTVESTGTSIVWWLLIPFVAAALGLILLHAFRERTQVVTPDALLRELCYAHRIDAPGRQLLGIVAETASITNPASMFITARTYDAAITEASKTKKFDRRDQTTLRMLRRQLFSLTY